MLRALDVAVAVHDSGRSESLELLETLRRTFRDHRDGQGVHVGGGGAAASAILLPADGITMNRERLLTMPKQARWTGGGGYAAPVPRTDIPAPGENMLASLKLGVHMMRQGEFISDHDVKVANWVAYVLCGGSVTPGHAGERTVSAGPGAGGVPFALRREEDAGADRLHAEEREAAEELDSDDASGVTGGTTSRHERRSHCSAVRTAVGKAPKGTLRATRPDDLAAVAIKGALERVPQLDVKEIEDVIIGCAMPEASRA